MHIVDPVGVEALRPVSGAATARHNSAALQPHSGALDRGGGGLWG